MRVWFIKHKPTGYYLPEPTGRQGRGGSHTEPMPASDNTRIFHSEKSAKNALSAWLRGKYVANRGMGSSGPDWDGEYYEEIEIIPVPTRIREDMEIIYKDINL